MSSWSGIIHIMLIVVLMSNFAVLHAWKIHRNRKSQRNLAKNLGGYALVCDEPVESRSSQTEKEGRCYKSRSSCRKYIFHNGMDKLFVSVHTLGSVLLLCPSAYSDLNIHWTHDKRPLEWEKKNESHHISLAIHEFGVKNEGRYECEVKNGTQLLKKAIFMLKTGKAPKAKTSVKHLVGNGTSEKFSCDYEDIDGNYSLMNTVKTWTKINGELDPNRYNVSTSGVLSIYSIEPSDAGQYECKIQNHYGTSYFIMNLTIGNLEKYIDISIGDDLELECMAYGSVIWKRCCKEGQIIELEKSGGELHVYTKSDVTDLDSGNYYCYMDDFNIISYKVTVKPRV